MVIFEFSSVLAVNFRNLALLKVFRKLTAKNTTKLENYHKSLLFLTKVSVTICRTYL